MRFRLPAIGIVACALVATAQPAAAQAPSSVSTPVLRETPSEALYLDPVFDFSKTRSDVVYGRNVNAEGELQDLLLDVWEPSHDAETRPVVVWISGGGFTNVSKDGPSVRARTEGFLSRGYVVVSIIYRVRDTGPGSFMNILNGDPVDFAQESIAAIEDAIEDAKAAVRWVRANAEDLRADPDRIAVAGWSAGAITSLGLAFDSADPGDSGNPGWSNDVSVAIAGAGAYAPALVGDAIEPGDPPIQIFHGTHDVTVPMAAGLLPCVLTVAVGNVCEAHLYPEGDHGLAPHIEDWEARTVSFLYRHMIDPQPFPMDR